MAWFINYLGRRAASLPCATLYDCAPSRDRTLAGGSLYTYKAMGTSSQEEVLPSEFRRGHLRKFITGAFGEVDAVFSMDNARGICIRLRCPIRGSCTVMDAYGRQLGMLHEILDADDVELGGTVRGSWFAATTLINAEEKEKCFYIYLVTHSREEHAAFLANVKPGRLAEVAVSFQRIDLPNEDGSNDREYSLLGHHLIPLVDTDIPTRGGEPIARQLAYLGPHRRPLLCQQRMIFAGCVTDLVYQTCPDGTRKVHIVLASPRFPNATAVEISRRQENFLLEIANDDRKAAEQPCDVSWGPTQIRRTTPTAVITMPNGIRQMNGQGSPRRVAGLYDIRVGHDLVVAASLTRVDKLVHGVLLMGPLYPRAVFNGVAGVDNPGALANGVVTKHFAPTRDGSVPNGSRYTYKAINAELTATSQKRGSLVKYYPSFFGQIASIIPVGDLYVFQLSSPTKGSEIVNAAYKAAYSRQIKALAAIIDDESFGEGSTVGRSWFVERDTTNLQDRDLFVSLVRVPSDYVIGTDIVIGSIVGMWGNLVRIDTDDFHNNKRFYSLESDSFVRLLEST
ncbi:hypothetical protein DFH06DRAFT_1135700 [Mycena polygramma]|nr:hypothetical protein DFH06DRAFT_1135700 [Mycena polygramma]